MKRVSNPVPTWADPLSLLGGLPLHLHPATPYRPPPALTEHLPQAGPCRHKEAGDGRSLAQVGHVLTRAEEGHNQRANLQFVNGEN